jgi:hypothetical protein
MKHRQNVFLGKLASMRWIRRVAVALAVVLAVVLGGCSAGDPPNPEAAGLPPAPEDADDARDDVLDAIEERFEDRGVKDVRGEPGAPVTIRLEDELTVAAAAEVCAAVRAAGFVDVQVDVDGIVSPCP